MRGKLVILAECPWVPSSVGKITMLLATGLAERGYEVTVFCAAGFKTLTGKGVPYNPRRWCLNEPLCPLYPDVDIPVYQFLGAERFRDQVREYVGKPDAVIAYATPYAPPGTDFNDAISKSRLPSVLYAISEVLHLGTTAAASVIAHTVVTAPTRWCLNEFIEGLRVLYTNVDEVSDRFMVVPHGLDQRLYNPETCKLVEKPWESGRLKIGVLAKDHIRKDVYALVRAGAELVKRGYDIELHLYLVKAATEPVWDLNSVVSTVERETGVDMSGRLRVLDPQISQAGLTESEVIGCYCTMDILAFPSLGESFGLPPLEAVLLGVPTVASEHPALREVWGDSMPLVRCTPFRTPLVWLCLPDPLDLADKLEELTDPEARRKIWQREYERARQYTKERMIDAMEKAIQKAAEEGKSLATKLKPRKPILI